MAEFINHFACPTVLYTNRRMLREQTSGVMEDAGIVHGIRASGCDPALLRDVQVSSIMTEESRVYKRKEWELHKAKLVLLDECHNQTGNVAKKIIDAHEQDGALCLAFTGTPLDLEGMWSELVIAGRNSELRECGAHVICKSWAPDEPDDRMFKNVKIGEDLSEPENVKAIMRPGIFGRVYDHWKRINPDARPTILFGPDVAGSLWFAEQFQSKGVPSAHIDGERVWIKGEVFNSDQEARDELAQQSEAGAIKVVCNRFVMREGIDWPWLYHCIMASVFGSLTSYLQSGGRLLRSHTSLDHVVLQDHGGNWHRHGSLNADRDWFLGLTSHIATAMRRERLREKKIAEPIVCSQCGRIRHGGPECPQCGHKSTKRSRVVVQHDGKLTEVEGEVYKPRKIRQKPDTERLWESMYHRAKRSRNGMTFTQAYGLFFYENHYWPPKNLRMMPTSDLDWHSKVRDVPASALVATRQEQVA